MLVVCEVDAGGAAQQPEDALPQLLFEGGRLRRGQVLGAAAERGEVAGEIRQPARELGRGQDRIGHACADGAARHAVESGRTGLLREHDAARFLDRLGTARAVGARAGEHHPDRAAPALRGERAEQRVDGARIAAGDAQHAAREQERGVRRNDVQMVGGEGHAVARFGDRHCCLPGQDLGQHAAVRRVEVLHQHERHPGRRRQLGEQLRHRLQPPGRRTDAGDREGRLRQIGRSRVFHSPMVPLTGEGLYRRGRRILEEALLIDVKIETEFH